MDLKKQLLTLHVIAKDLDLARLQRQALTKSIVRFKRNDSPQLGEIEERINGFLAIATARKSISKLAKQQKKLHAMLVSNLKEVNFPEGKRIEINEEHYGRISFWYKGSKVHFVREENQQNFSA